MTHSSSADQHPAHAPGVPITTVIGDGQLARMMHSAAIELGQSIRLLAGAPHASAAQVVSDCLIGDYTNLADLRQAAAGATALTFDHEHVPTECLHKLIAEGVNVQPGPEALIYAQDKLLMRQKLREIGAPVPPFAAINCEQDIRDFAEAVSGEVCLKACRGGYDGHGVWFPSTPDEAAALVTKLRAQETPLMAEKKVPLTRELSTMVARRPSGEVRAWPVVESVQSEGICAEAVAPAPGLSPELSRRAQDLAVRIAEELGVTGVLAVELFEYLDEANQPSIAVNELAMRPHNTGHWTQDGCVTSQFEQHLRAVNDQPLGATSMLAPVTVMANVLGGANDPAMPMSQRMMEVWRRFPEAKIHLYGKTHRPGRKIGHVNVSGDDVATTRENARLAADFLVHAEWADGMEI
ncbi:5-(carboxyamino)imidazole ribonucleotide synthase [Corynebacterium poyangense]|uniref:N5-carboxyaminoimidazole ribonucleotide synthase n=1 Tax=Corynebacterium poyangense TaxID=2684405 RepID=A0A7H0SMG9_9CORY|nr:5-(carboxyamino)imidazole ribonucleotide synthase [Corynebacterium poyangense]MBZ8176847.1 5-(carboxyamino)imidazole ribonucleotide synthase [Corynebacterium poyangense]QNQ89744.1 5-(carboxyamino)imidazole ribonucleotide synthase [Corynebacterium poyangense]